eukprot:SAG31_NODE_615_length_13521_cov_43.196916_14_plen_87_part_00
MKPDTLLSYALPAEHEVLNLVFRSTSKRGSTCTVLLITLLSNRYRLVVAAILKLYIYLRCTLPGHLARGCEAGTGTQVQVQYLYYQ